MTISENPRNVSNERNLLGKTFVIRTELFDNRVDPTNGSSLPVDNVLIISSFGSLTIVVGLFGSEMV